MDNIVNNFQIQIFAIDNFADNLIKTDISAFDNFSQYIGDPYLWSFNCCTSRWGNNKKKQVREGEAISSINGEETTNLTREVSEISFGFLCFCVFVFVYLYLCISISVFVFVFVYFYLYFYLYSYFYLYFSLYLWYNILAT